jgi:hypothetical protein
MRRFLPVLCALAVLLALPAAASSQVDPRITAKPRSVDFGERLTVRGRGWPVIEFCSRTVRIALQSDQNAFRIGVVRVGTRGRFTFRHRIRRSEVGAGRWRVVARMSCESGEDGSPVPLRRSVAIRIG